MSTESSSTNEPEPQAGLRRDLSELSAVLGRTLVRQEGADLLDLFERVRRLIGTDREAAADVLTALDTVSATRLVRAFATYFHLANVAEQVHRGRELEAVHRRRGTWLSQAVDQIAAAGLATSDIAADLQRVALRPVFTAHPTEAARRSVLTKIQQIGRLLEQWDRALGPGDGPSDRVAERRVRRRLEELVDLLVADRRVARRAAGGDRRGAQRRLLLRRLHRDAVPQTLRAFTDELARLGLELPLDARPLTFGTWIGGDRDGNPNVTAETMLDVLALQHDHAIRDALRLVDELRNDLSPSVRIAGVTAELESSLAADLENLHELDRATAPERRGALPAQADGDPAEAAQHPPPFGGGRAARAGTRLPRRRRAPRRPRSSCGTPCWLTAESSSLAGSSS